MNSEERLKKMIKQVETELTNGSLTIYEENWVKDYIKSNMFKDIEELLNQNQQLKEENKDYKEIICNDVYKEVKLRKYQTNWKKLKEWLKEEDNWDYTPFNEAHIMVDKVLIKMQEIGGSND